MLDPDGTAADNLAYFDATNSDLIAAGGPTDGRSFIDHLVAAGFTKEHMEVTFDATSVGLDADSVQFAVRWAEECLIGQYGPASGGYHSLVAPRLSTGTCLAGQTRPIDW